MSKKTVALFLALLLLMTACAKPEVPVASSENIQASATEPSSEVTVPTETEPSNPLPSDPKPTDPKPTDPLPTDPKPTDPQPTTPKPKPPKPPLPDPDPSGVKEITLSFVGDCTFGRNQKHSYANSFTEMYDKKGPDYFFQKVRDIFENDDITVVNLEGSLTTSNDIQDKLWNHKGDPEYVQIMTGSSVEVATMGNNHRLDYGQSGCDETEQVLMDAGIGYCYDDIYLIQQVKGIRVGFVSVNEHYDGPAVEKWLTEGYQYLRQQGCSIVVACVHWGLEKTPELNSYQMSLGYKLIDMGYDLVVGNHPHVLQAIQVYKGKYICYSLGNFCYGGNKNPDDKDSGIFQQTFTLVDGEIQDETARFIPCRLSGVDTRNNYQPTPVTGAEHLRIIEKMNSYSHEFGFAWDVDGTPARVEHEVVAGHVHNYATNGAVVPPTCTEPGYQEKFCICGEMEKVELTPASGHQYAPTAVIPPTVDAQGYTIHTCPNCGDSYQDDFTDYVPEPELPEQEEIEDKNTSPDFSSGDASLCGLLTAVFIQGEALLHQPVTQNTNADTQNDGGDHIGGVVDI